jgi:hypothetical protein
MRVESYLVSEMLQRLELQLANLRPHTVQFATAIGKHEYVSALEASAELHRVLDAIVATTEILRDHIVQRDELGKLGEALGELALRARGYVIVTQLDLMQIGLTEPSTLARTRAWFAGRFQGIADVRAFVRERIGQIHAIWKPYRKDQPPLPGMTETERATIYHTMIRVAQRALCELCDEPDLARFLDSGVAANDMPDIHVGCKQILTVLNLQIDVEPTRPLPRRPRRAGAAHGATEPR